MANTTCSPRPNLTAKSTSNTQLPSLSPAHTHLPRRVISLDGVKPRALASPLYLTGPSDCKTPFFLDISSDSYTLIVGTLTATVLGSTSTQTLRIYTTGLHLRCFLEGSVVSSDTERCCTKAEPRETDCRCILMVPSAMSS